ncbi:MAG: methionine--tRNA ligase [Pseudomonadota bacterium]
MSPEKRFYITTPIYYVNGKPHIGHAYTSVAADVAARWRRLKGERVFFLTGTDEHGQKVLDKARERGMEPQAHCDDMVVHWKRMGEQLGITNDHFVRTTDPAHQACVQATLQDLWDRGEIYRATYEGWYCTSCERFWMEKDLVDGRCPDNGTAVTKIEETNYFFKMGKYQQALMDHIEQHADFIQPEKRRNEVLGFLRRPLEDLCISRPKERMSWGIELPFDQDFVTYVWFDALLNYLSVPGYRPGGDDGWQDLWPADYHLVGKDILTTHSVYWTTMLMGMGVPLPKHIFAHGWWMSADGEKMSKSLGNAIDTDLLIEAYGVDALRYFLMREIAFGADGNFSYEGFQTRYNADLANDLGNLAHRGLSMTTGWLGGVVPAAEAPTELEAELLVVAHAALQACAEGMDTLAYKAALDGLWELVRAGNKYVDTAAPWALNKKGQTARLATVMRTVLEVCNLAAACLLPVMPTRMEELLGRLGRTPAQAGADLRAVLAGDASPFGLLPEGGALTHGEPLFPRFRELPPAIAALFPAPEPAPAARHKPAEDPAPSTPEDAIDYDHFAKVRLRVGRVLQAEHHPKADKLLVLQVDVGEDAPRQIVAGIALKFAPEALVGRNIVVVCNLEPVKLRGVWSNGMLLAASDPELADLLTAQAKPGAVVK